MAFKMDCPHCKRTLNVPEAAFGKTVPCPGCNQTLTVPQQPESVSSPHPVGAQASSRGVERQPQAQASSTSPLPKDMPPVPGTTSKVEPEESPWGFLDGVPSVANSQSHLNPRVSLVDLPIRIRELIFDGDDILYASRPSQSALALDLIKCGILWGFAVFPILLGAISSLGSAALLVFFILCVLLVIGLTITYFSWKNHYYVITTQRTIVSQGIFDVGISVVLNRHIQLVSINTGIVDRWLGLNRVELSTAAQGGGGGIMARFRASSKGSVQLIHVDAKDIVGCYRELSKG